MPRQQQRLSLCKAGGKGFVENWSLKVGTYQVGLGHRWSSSAHKLQIESNTKPNTHETRYNTLLRGVARQLADLKKAVKGLVVVTPELEDISQALLQGKVRQTWRSACIDGNVTDVRGACLEVGDCGSGAGLECSMSVSLAP